MAVGAFVMHRETLHHSHSLETVLVARPRAGLSPAAPTLCPRSGAAAWVALQIRSHYPLCSQKHPPFFPPKDCTGKGR